MHMTQPDRKQLLEHFHLTPPSQTAVIYRGVTTSSDQLPSDLAVAHVMIVALRSEALIRRLETEKLKLRAAEPPRRRHDRAGAGQRQTATGRLWTYVRDDRPFGGTDPPAAAFHYSRSRLGEYPRGHLAAYRGIMQADAFAGYSDPYDVRRKPAPIVEAACWSHGRRKLFDIAKLDNAPIAA